MDITTLFSPSRQERILPEAGVGHIDVISEAVTPLPRKPSLRTNFSYPSLSRHESSESRSSNGSLPGMTDSSDSDLSFDDDCVYRYNTSAGQLWDSFWPDNVVSPVNEPYPAVLPATNGRDYFSVNHSRRQPPVEDDDTIRIAPISQSRKTGDSSQGQRDSRASPQRKTIKTPVTYSVYPKTCETTVQRRPHPPRTSSLTFNPPPPPRRQLFSKGSKPHATLRSSKSSYNLTSIFTAPPVLITSEFISKSPRSSTKATAAVSVPVSPAYPPFPLPNTLRASASASALRDANRASNGTCHNATAPLTPLLPSSMPEGPLPRRPRVERFVSVFELDSDSDREGDDGDESSNSFAKRIARGLHKKSASEKRGVAERKAVTADLTAVDPGVTENDLGTQKPKDGGSLSRKRGGSLGRILGLMSR
ncbi:hypothetical protein F5Y18DRAFT_285766 [Xylariaceae sp. FL1019]|nr:hypothetical protein F5Y18DRAFT_285766 [Xylariaceae sp. FL1019]